ncbi:MAG: hypothetical protein D6723_02675 [Acidobacteria bacterium]|nr:MAG: hypothetical protein D6723_02675 [Acidobacteriota bacterium]
MERFKLFSVILTAMLVMSSQVFTQDTDVQSGDFQDAYFQFGNLNEGAVNVGSSWTKLNTGTHSFTKNRNDTAIEVHVNSRFGVGSLNANGVLFQVRIDDVHTPDYENQGSILRGSILANNITEFLSIFAVFQNIPAGSHTVSIWARAAPSGSAHDVLVDPGDWRGKIIVKVPDDLTR